ncbi:hypothetical protein CDD83_10580 [Cordyceps sp. RAO-2017]|nr:hypothetical protein CDD83_10580 [Cordyceps sp. RAO-2017]
MKVLIAGAGLSGLGAAFCLARRGHEVHLFERHAQVASRGGDINTRPSASRIMHSWGLGPELGKIAMQSPSVVIRDLQSGAIAMRTFSHASAYRD